MLSTRFPPHRFEEVPAGEEEQIRQIADLTVQLLQRRYPGDRLVKRGVHPKDHGCLRAVFQVNSDIAEDLRVGVFQEPGRTYDAWLRFSNAAALVGPDLEPGKPDNERHGSRGMAIKLLGVDSEPLIPHQGPTTQDFLMVNLPVFPFANVADYLALTEGLVASADVPAKAFEFFAQRVVAADGEEGKKRVLRAGQISAQIKATAVSNPLASPYFSAAPFLFGDDRIMKFSAVPVGMEPKALAEWPSDGYLRDSLSAYILKNEAHFEFRVQIRTGDEQPAVEDVTVEWPEAQTPFRRIATITIPRQEVDTPQARDVCEKLFFTPWHGIKAHQPLGGINRLRNEVYFASSLHRHHPKEPSC